MNRPTAALVLPLRFFRAMLVSGVQTVGIILRSGLRGASPPPAVYVRMAFAPMSAQGAALLACMICLTPGSTVIDIDMEQRRMLVHMLDGRDAAAAVQAIRREFEAPLRVLFGRGGA